MRSSASVVEGHLSLVVVQQDAQSNGQPLNLKGYRRPVDRLELTLFVQDYGPETVRGPEG